ncbi:MAG: Rrf2 family transcriptional regulator [Rothia sp. (in: high G+C Gram-positive bacteria)]|nr:Rrf2 family transcriptional regulator [Rothia sp. (in: high G+C Gram-positive bacteria)]
MDTKFSVAIHTLVMISETEDKLTSETIATSVGTNASYIRKVISLLKNAGLLERIPGSFDYQLGKPKQNMTLLDIYRAVNPNIHIDVHQNANPDCPVGGHINAVLEPIAAQAEDALAQQLAAISLDSVIEDIRASYLAQEPTP